MGNCLHCNNGKHKKIISLLIVGLDNAGKTTAAKRVQGLSINTVAPTLGYTSDTFTFDKFNVTMIDVGGGRRIRDIWKNYFAEIHGLIYVVDSSDVERLEESRIELEQLLSNPLISKKPVLLLANKQDKAGALDEVDISEHLNLEAIVNEHKSFCKVEMCAAIMDKKDRSMKNGLLWLLTVIANEFHQLSTRIEADIARRDIELAKEKELKRERVRKWRQEREAQEAASRALDDGNLLDEGQRTRNTEPGDRSAPLPVPNDDRDLTATSGIGHQLVDDNQECFEDIDIPGSVQQSRVSLRDKNNLIENNADNRISGIIRDSPFPAGARETWPQDNSRTGVANNASTTPAILGSDSARNFSSHEASSVTPTLDDDGGIKTKINKVVPISNPHVTDLPPLKPRGKLLPIAGDAGNIVNGATTLETEIPGASLSFNRLPPLKMRPNMDSEENLLV